MRNEVYLVINFKQKGIQHRHFRLKRCRCPTLTRLASLNYFIFSNYYQSTVSVVSSVCVSASQIESEHQTMHSMLKEYLGRSVDRLSFHNLPIKPYYCRLHVQRVLMKDFALTRSPTRMMHGSYALLYISGNKEFLKTYFH